MEMEMMAQAVKTSGAVRAVGDCRPKDGSGREIISIKSLLEWAFATECASLDYDEAGAVAGNGWASVSATAGVAQMMELSREPGACVRVDTSRGRSYPHDDAEMVATVLRNAVPFAQATWVADLARSCRAPDWMPDAVARLVPLGMHCNRHGWHPKTDDAGKLGGAGWPAQPRRNRKGVVVRDVVRYTPCKWEPTPSQIASARRAYLDWWGVLLYVAIDLRRVGLTRFSLSDRMPPMTPWRKEA